MTKATLNDARNVSLEILDGSYTEPGRVKL